MNGINFAGVLLAFLALGTGIILLQIFLSKKENKWAGLMLPIISLCISLIAVFSIVAFTAVTEERGGVQIMGEDGIVIQQTAPETTVRTIQSASSLIFTVASVFFLGNIPTAVLLAIYFGCREGQRKRRNLDKMKAQDLG